MPDTLESEPIPKDRPIYWDHNGETSIDPPSDAIRAVIFAPPPDKTNRAGVESIGETLSKRGFAIWLTEISETVDVRQIFSAIDTSSVFITISNPYLLDNNESLAVLRSALTYAASKGKTRHYGISLDGISILTDIIRYVADASTVTLTEDSRRVAAQVANTYFAEMAGANVREEATKERRERLERNASDFVDEALATLQDRERRWKRAAYGWHSVGFFALLQFINLESSSKSEVAYWCHIGGMAAGAALFPLMRPAGVVLFECIRAPKVPVVVAGTDQLRGPVGD